MPKVATLLLALLLLTVAGCSSGSESTTTQPADSTTAGADSTIAESTTVAAETTAASETTAGASGALGVDPCALLTAAEITTATGIDFGDGVFNEDLSGDAQAICDWLSSGSEFATAQVLILDAGAGAFDSNMASAEEVFGLATDPVNVAGAGQSYATAEGSIVGMDIGGLFVQVSYIPPGPGNVLDATLELAAIAAGRMP